MKIRYMLLVVATQILLAEPSVYSKAVTYRGSSSAGEIYSLRQQVASLKEQVEGLKSIVESLSSKVGKRSNSSSGNLSEIDMLKERVARLETIIKSQKQSATAQNQLPVKKSSTLATNNMTSTTKIDFQSKKNGGYDDKSSAKLYKKGVIIFDKKRYSEAKNIFEVLWERKYKPAATSFYLGEIAYKTGRYRDAIKYYQRSAELDENAAYMDRLLLHTGISLEKDGDKEQARRFYQAIVDAYPGTSSARVAKKRLK